MQDRLTTGVNIDDKYKYIFFMYLSVVLSLIFLSIGGKSISPLFNLVGWVYSISFFLAILFMKKQFSLSASILLFLSFELTLFLFNEFNGVFDSFVIGDPSGDEMRYHIPHALNLDTLDKRIQYIFSFEVQNGRFTHILLSFYIDIVKFLQSSSEVTGGGIARVAFIFNVLISVVSIKVVYKTALSYSKNILFSQRAAWFVAVNPVFIGMAGTAKKEPILFLAVSIFLLYIVKSDIKKVYLLLISSFIIVLDRFYTLPVMLGILMFYRKKRLITVFLIFLTFVLLTELLFGFNNIYSRYLEHVEGHITLNSSLVPVHNIFFDVLRTVFGPAFVRVLDNDMQTITFGSSFLTISLYPLIFYKSLFFREGLDKSILFLFLFVALLIPFQSPFKLLMLTAFAPYFLERISFIKYLPRQWRFDKNA